MTFTKVATAIDLLYDRMMGIENAGKNILVAKMGDRYFALENTCTHEGCKLSGGKIINGTIRCPCHGSVFDPSTGKVLRGPAERPVRVYHIKVERGSIWVDL